ncbi:hypothetical protein K457DRAFT_575734 [Linnemannia elongata AG-77]|uniref:Uncharacterized protein n=1 Tax=Linnemannia elongata AG-77 TaxID=1314771 RepID=A0A197KGA5_9FUNG|nr:hypothetical protein K457DRAFT_575734 [Linnemannia elongata AG-77]
MGSKLGLYCPIACTIIGTSAAFHLTLPFTFFFLPASHCHARGCLLCVCMVMVGRMGVSDYSSLSLSVSLSFSYSFFILIADWDTCWSIISPHHFLFNSTVHRHRSFSSSCSLIHFCDVVA